MTSFLCDRHVKCFFFLMKCLRWNHAFAQLRNVIKNMRIGELIFSETSKLHELGCLNCDDVDIATSLP